MVMELYCDEPAIYETIADKELVELDAQVIKKIELFKKNLAIDTSGTNYSEKRMIFDKLRKIDTLEAVLDELSDGMKMDLSFEKAQRKKFYDERQEVLREAVALNMHLDVNAVHVRLPWNGTSEQYRTTSFKEYVTGLLEKYQVNLLKVSYAKTDDGTPKVIFTLK